MQPRQRYRKKINWVPVLIIAGIIFAYIAMPHISSMISELRTPSRPHYSYRSSSPDSDLIRELSRMCIVGIVVVGLVRIMKR